MFENKNLKFVNYWTDSHVHLNLMLNHESAVKSAYNTKVLQMLIPSTDIQSFVAIKNLSETYDFYYALGLHPCFKHDKQDIAKLDKHLSVFCNDNSENNKNKQSRCIAVGEIGLDFINQTNLHSEQEYLFSQQLNLAKDYNLPVIIHAVKSHDRILHYLKKIRPKSGMIHAFNASAEIAQEYLKLGFYLGLGGILSYSNAHKLHNLAANLPLECFLLESDAPRMPPAFAPYEKNQPSVAQYGQILADLRGISTKYLMHILYNNFHNLFLPR